MDEIPTTKPVPRGAWSRPLRALREDERGISLVLALLVVAALSVSTAALAQLVTSNEHAFGRDRQETLAFNSAEAGVNYGVSYLSVTGDPSGGAAPGALVGSSTSPQPYPAGTGDGGWWAVKGPNNTWRIWATGTSPTGQVIREVSVKVKAVTAPGTTVPASTAWTYGLFVGNPGASCFTPTGSANLTISIYVKGCINLSGNVGIAEPGASVGTVKVYAETTLAFSSGAAQIGTSSQRVYSVIAPGGCTGKSGNACSAGSPQGSTSKVYAQNYGGPSQNIPKPPMNPDVDAYNKGDWANPNCTVGTFTFDNDSTRNKSLGNVDLFPSSSYNCSVHAPGAPSTIVGTLAWNNTTKVLTGSGLIFVDGDLQLNSNTATSYSAGTFLSLYVDGTVGMNGTAAFCGPPSVPSGGTCSTPKWDGAVGAIAVTAVNAQGSGNPLAIGWKANGGVYYDVAAYVVGQYSTSGNSGITGPVICDTASVSGNGSQSDVSNPPPGTPGSTTTSPGTTQWGVIPASWQQLKPS